MRWFTNKKITLPEDPATAPEAHTTAQDVVIEQVSKCYSVRGRSFQALANVNLHIRGGQLVTVVGPSGCGKTTLMHLIGGFETPTTGCVRVGTSIVDKPGPDRGMIFQEATLFPWRTVAGNVGWPLQVRGVPRRVRRARVEQLLELVGLAHFAGSYPSELSGGMRQRVGIARTLAMSPQILLMDEPFGALDAQTREQMQLELLALWRSTGLTVVFITHDISEAILLGDRVIVMGAQPGRIIEDCEIDLGRPRSIETLFESRATAYQTHIRGLINSQSGVGGKQ